MPTNVGLMCSIRQYGKSGVSGFAGSWSLKQWAQALACVFMLILLTFLSLPAVAQTESGEVSGLVTASSGSPVAGVMVRAVLADSGVVRSTRSNDRGFYALSALKPGDYELSVETEPPGIGSQKIRVSVGSHLRVDFRQAVPGDDPPPATAQSDVNVQWPALSRVISYRQITQLATLTRNP